MYRKQEKCFKSKVRHSKEKLAGEKNIVYFFHRIGTLRKVLRPCEQGWGVAICSPKKISLKTL